MKRLILTLLICFGFVSPILVLPDWVFGAVVVEDDMQTDNTGDWNKADCTLAFDGVNLHYEITRTAGTQTIYQQDSVSFVDGVYYEAVFDIKDGSASGETVSLLVGDSFHGAEVLDEAVVTTGSWIKHTFYFTATATTDSICFSSDFPQHNTSALHEKMSSR